MDDIICECGHSIDAHYEYGCLYQTDNREICDCMIAPGVVEARHQLKQITAERDTLKQRVNELQAYEKVAQMNESACVEAWMERDALAKKLEVASRAIEQALDSGIWMYDYPYLTSVYNDLQIAKAELARLDEKGAKDA